MSSEFYNVHKATPNELLSPIPLIYPCCVRETFETYSGLEICGSQSMSPLLHLENLDQVFKQEMRLLVNVTALAAEVALAICHIHLSPRGSSGEYEMNTIS